MREQHGVWVGWPGAISRADDPFEADGLTLVPVDLVDREFEEYYEGMSNGTLWPLYHDLVAKPEFHREWWDAYVAVNQRFAERPRRRRGRAWRGVGAGLPAPAGAGHAPRAAPGRADRFLPAHPLPAERAVPPAALAGPHPRRPARRRPGRLPATGRGVELRSGWCGSGSATRPTATGSSWPTDATSWPAPTRSRSTSRGSRAGADARGGGSSGRQIRRDLGNPRSSSSASTGSTTPRASASACAPSASSSSTGHQRRGVRLRPGRLAQPGAGPAVPPRCATTSSDGRPDQRRPGHDRPPGDPLPPLVVPARGDGRALPGRRRHGRHAVRATG